MSVFNAIFGNAAKTGTPPVNPNTAPAPAPQIAQPTQGNIPADSAAALAAAQSAGTAPNGTVPVNAATTGGAKSGLDQFAELFNTDPNAQQQGQPLFNVTHEKVVESARKQDFSIKPSAEHMAAIAAGGEGAVVAMMEMMNTVAQNAYAQATFTTTKLIEGGLEKGQYARTADVESRIRSTSVNESLRNDNPLFSHPAAQPLLQSLQAQLLVKFPNATSAEIKNMANQYVAGFAELVKSPEQQAQQQKESKSKAGDDWSNFFN